MHRATRRCLPIIFMAALVPTVWSAQPESMSIGTSNGSAPAAPDATVLWDQPLSAANTNAYASQDFFPVNDAYDIAVADDFLVETSDWQIQTISVTGNTWNSGGDLTCAVAFRFFIFDDAGGVPSGHPWGGASPAWSVTVAPSDPRVTLSTGTGGFLTDVALHPSPPLLLEPGHYWLVFAPEMEFATCGQYGRQVSDTTNLHHAVVINPLGGFGFPTSWTPVTDPATWSLAESDLAFSLAGNVLPPGQRVAIASNDYVDPVEHDLLAAELAGLGYSPVDVTGVRDANAIGAMALVVYAGGYYATGLEMADLQSWVNSGHGLIQIGEWHEFFPSEYVGRLPVPTSVAVTVHNAWHPVVQGVASSWSGRGFFFYGWADGALGYTINCVGETDLAHGDAPGFPAHDYVIAAVDRDPPARLGRAVFFGINTYGPDAGPNEHQLLVNAMNWISADQLVFRDGFECGSCAEWSATVP